MAACPAQVVSRHPRELLSLLFHQRCAGFQLILLAWTATYEHTGRRRRSREWLPLPAHGAAATREQLQTPPSSRKHLARITQAQRVHGALDPQHLRDVVLTEDQRHQ